MMAIMETTRGKTHTSRLQAIAICDCVGVDIVEELLSKLNNKNNAK